MTGGRAVLGAAVVIALAWISPQASASGTAFCGPDDKPEPGLQGQNTLADMASGRSQEPYSCGLKSVGHNDMLNRGANWQLAKIDECAYVSTIKTSFFGPNDPAQTRYPAGIAVIDARNPADPKLTEILREPGGLDSSETMHAWQSGSRKVLVAGSYAGGFQTGNTGGPTAPMTDAVMDVYDASDCAHPKHSATYTWPTNAHNLTVSPSARFVYGTGGNGVMVLDVQDMANPKLVGNFALEFPEDGGTTTCHTVHFDARETRMYCAGTLSSAYQGSDPPEMGSDGPSIWDVSDITSGVKDAKIRFVGEADKAGEGGHHVVPAMIGGKPYLVGADELALGPAAFDQRAGCPSGAFPMIWDIADERHPRWVGQFRLEVQDHCADPGAEEENRNGNYGTHYNNVDDYWSDTKLGIWGWTASGVRIVDLRDPTKPREIAYFKPGANPGTTLVTGVGNFYFNSATVDACGGYGYWNPRTQQIWMNCEQNGFYIAELSDQARAYMGLGAKPSATSSPPPAAKPRHCRRTVSLRVKLPKGRRAKRAVVLVNGKRVRRVRLRVVAHG